MLNNKIKEWLIALIALIPTGYLVILWSDLILNNFLWAITIFVFAPVFQFLSTPLFTVLGVYYYLSPMLLVYNPSKIKYDLHNGTSYNYLQAMRSYKAGRPARKALLLFYMQGLYKIIEKIEQEELPESVKVRGSSYFFSETTAKRLGFAMKPAGFAEKLNILFNYLDLLWMYSYAHGYLKFPNLAAIKTVEMTGSLLMEKKDVLQNYIEYLKK